MRREAREQRPEVAARLAVAALGSGGDRADEVGALEADRVVARPEEEAFDDAVEARVGAAVLGEVGEEAAQPCVVLAEAAVDDDHPDVVRRLEQQLEALGEEHQTGGVRVLVGAEELRCVAQAELDVEQGHVAADGCARERADDGVGERRWHLPRADPVPLDLAVDRPPVCGERLLPQVAEAVPLGVADCDAAEREEAPLRELAGLVEEEQVHGRIGTHDGAGRQRPTATLGGSGKELVGSSERP